jgi:CyaY protein
MSSDNPYAKVTLTETDFHARIDALMVLIEDAVSDHADDCDAERAGGILTIGNARGKIIVTRQAPLREVWVAAKSGGYHFRFDGAQWIDTRDGLTLTARLNAAFTELGESNIPL